MFVSQINKCSHNISFQRYQSCFPAFSRCAVVVVVDAIAEGALALQTTFFDYVWENVFLTIDDLLIPCEIWDERKRSLDCEKILAFSPGGKSALTNIELYIWSVINSTWNGGPWWQSWTPVLLIAPAVPVNKYFPISLSVCLSVFPLPTLSVSSSPPPRCLEGEVPLIICVVD